MIHKIIRTGIKMLEMTVLLLLFFHSETTVYAQEREQTKEEEDSITEWAQDYMEDFSLEEIDDTLDKLPIFNGYEGESFQESVNDMISRGESFSVQTWLKELVNRIENELSFQHTIFLSLCVLALSCAVFTAFTRAFSSKQLSQTGFFVTYLMLFSMLSVVFREGVVVAQKVIEAFGTFMKAMLPAYFLSISVQIGAEGSVTMYELALGVLNVSCWMLQTIFLPLIQIYFLLMMGQHLSGEDRISKLVEGVEKLVTNGLKIVLGAIIGLQVIEGMVVPLTGQVKKAVILKGAAMVPGVGNAWESVAQTVLGAGSLIQGAIGSVGVIFLVLIGVIPMIRLWLYRAYFALTSILVQPVSDQRVTECIHGASKASGMLMSAVLISFLTMFFTIALLAVTVPKGVL